MAEIMVRNLADHVRKGFKLGCTKLDVTMQEAMEIFVFNGFEYDDNRILIDMLIKTENWKKWLKLHFAGSEIDLKFEQLIVLNNSLSFYEYIMTLEKDKLFYSVSTKNAYDQLVKELIKIADIKKYLLSFGLKLEAEYLNKK